MFAGGRNFTLLPVNQLKVMSSLLSTSRMPSMACTRHWALSWSAMQHLQVGVFNVFNVVTTTSDANYPISDMWLIKSFWIWHCLLSEILVFLLALSDLRWCPSSLNVPHLSNTSPNSSSLSSTGCMMESFPCERKTLETMKELQGNFMCWKSSKGYSPYASLCPYYRQVCMKPFSLKTQEVDCCLMGFFSAHDNHGLHNFD